MNAAPMLAEPSEDPYDRSSGVHSSGRRSAEPDEALLQPGRLIGGRYEIGSRIGEGGHGAIYRARHVGLDLPVAVKVVAIDAGREEIVARFLREARTVARVRHRNVLDIHDAGALEDGAPYLVTELIEGQNLERRIGLGRLSVPAVIDLGRQLFSALAAIAEAGVVHRDVKPANLMLRREADGHVHLTLIDFGIARGRDEISRLTVSGAILGTPHYMSPEQLKGEPLDARADLYAACTVMYEALTGVPPFDGDTAPVVIGKILAAELPPLAELRPDCPADLRELIEQGLRRDRAERPAHPLELGVLLGRIAHHEGIPTSALAWQDDVMFGALASRSIANGALASDGSPVSGESPTGQAPAEDDERPSQGIALLGTAPIPLAARRKSAVPSAPRSMWPRFAVGVVLAAALVLFVGSSHRAPEPVSASADAPAPVPTVASPEREVQAGLEALARGEVDAALGHYRAAVLLDDTRPDAHRGRGLAAARAGFTDEAITSLERYLALNPDAGDAGRIRTRLRTLRSERR